jgi:hypothetical protein
MDTELLKAISTERVPNYSQSDFSAESTHSATSLLSEQILLIRSWAQGIPLPGAQINNKKAKKKKLSGSELLAVILSNRFCRSKGEESPTCLRVIETAIANERPIPISVLCGPLKNRRLNVPQQPDWAEVFMYAQLARLAGAVSEVYTPGIHLEVILDDARAAYANKISDSIFIEYSARLKALLDSFGLTESKVSVKSQRPIYEELGVLNKIEEASKLVTSFMDSDAGKCCWNTLARNSCENNCDEADSDGAAKKYLVAQRAEILAGFWNNPARIMLRYGQSPDFVPRLWTIRKGSMGLPWQGFGALLQLPNGEFRPAVWQPYRACSIQHLGWITPSVTNPYLPESLPVISEEACPADRATCGGCPNGGE